MAQYGSADAVGPLVRKPPLGQTQLWQSNVLLTSLIRQALDYTLARKNIQSHSGSQANIQYLSVLKRR